MMGRPAYTARTVPAIEDATRAMAARWRKIAVRFAFLQSHPDVAVEIFRIKGRRERDRAIDAYIDMERESKCGKYSSSRQQPA